MTLKTFMKKACRKILRAIKPSQKPIPIIEFLGDYPTWEAAQKDCEGYDGNTIFEKVSNATLAVKRGEAAYERDGVLFYKKDFNYPLCAYINKIALKKSDYLSVVDWGGALGSTYFQNKELLPEKINWTIVEQKHFVSFGKEKLQDDNLHFEYNLADIKNCDVIIFSSVLQYLDFYEDIVKTATERKIPFIILERTGVGSRFRIMKQIVREPIYEATYATCMFEEKKLIAMFESRGYKLIDSWSSLVDGVLQIGEDKMIDKSFVFKLNE